VPWLAASLVLSIVLTILLNIALRAVPGARERAANRLADFTRPRVDDETRGRGTLRVVAPWKAMLVGSLVLTAVLNAALWLR